MSRGDQRNIGASPGQQRTWKRTPAGDSTPSADAAANRSASPNIAYGAPSEPMGAEGAEDSFQVRLRYLFTTTRQTTGAPWSFNAVARVSAGRISAQAVYRLYTKADANPSLETIRVLADVFGVEPEYFVRAGALRQQQDWLERAYAQLEADPHIAFVSRRMGHMTEADKALLVEFVRRLTTGQRELEAGGVAAQELQVDRDDQESCDDRYEMRQNLDVASPLS